MMEM
jgi:hypothetical protein